MEAPSWKVRGIVVERKELKSKEGRTWAWMLKVMAMGGTFEMTTPTPEVWNRFGDGEEVIATGRFEHYNHAVKLIVTGREEVAAVADRPALRRTA